MVLPKDTKWVNETAQFLNTSNMIQALVVSTHWCSTVSHSLLIGVFCCDDNLRVVVGTLLDDYSSDYMSNIIASVDLYLW